MAGFISLSHKLRRISNELDELREELSQIIEGVIRDEIISSTSTVTCWPKKHKPWEYRLIQNTTDISMVKCSCGEVTNYKVPLRSLFDFECPKRKRGK
jgi:hypothetical protein